MKTLIRTSLITVVILTLSLSVRAQVLTANTLGTFDSATSWTNGAVLGDNVAVSQTFTGATSLANVTYRFIAESGASFAATDLDVAVSSWATNNAGVGGDAFFTADYAPLLASAAWTIDPGNASYKYLDATFDLSGVVGLTAASTYGISIIGTASTSGAIRVAAGNADYATGQGFRSLPGVVDQNALATVPGIALSGGADLLFVASSGGSGFSAVPESGSAAVLFAGLFVGSLMLRRQRHLRPSMVAAEA